MTTDTTAHDVHLREDAGRGRFWIELAGGLEAELTFLRSADGDMVITHTQVPHAFEGRGIAAILVRRAVSDARRDGFKIKPLCSYVATQFRRHPEWQDLLS